MKNDDNYVAHDLTVQYLDVTIEAPTKIEAIHHRLEYLKGAIAIGIVEPLHRARAIRTLANLMEQLADAVELAHAYDAA